MEVMKPWEDKEPETEDFGVALRGRLPRQETGSDDESPAIISTSTEIFTTSKFDDEEENDDGGRRNDDKLSSETSSDITQSSDNDKETDGNGVLQGENGHGNGDAEPTNGHSGLDDRYVDFLASEENPVDQPSDFEANDLSFRRSLVEVNRERVVEIEKVEETQKGNGVNEADVEDMEARLRKKIEEEFRELYLDKLTDHDKEKRHEFYCPNCKACITKVLVRERELELETDDDRFRCTSCFSFLIPIGKWLCPTWITGDDEPPRTVHVPVSGEGLHEPLVQPNEIPVHNVVTTVTTTMTQPVPTQGPTDKVHVSREIPVPKQPVAQPNEISVPNVVTTVTTTMTQTVPTQGSADKVHAPREIPVPKQPVVTATKRKSPMPDEPIGVSVSETPTDSEKNSDSQEKVRSSHSIGIYGDQSPARKLPEPVVSAAITPMGDPVSTGELPMPGEVILDVPGQDVNSGLALTTPVAVESRDMGLVMEPGVPKSLEIAKSIVYGGLVESITSLGIVTSAASGDVTTLNIVALALANLIGGLFVIAHNIWELKDDQSTVKCSITHKMVNKYQEVLGRKENFFLHATFAILSFILFGLVPPIVYGFTFRATDEKDLKIAAVGVASLICIAILAIGKAYIQRPNKYVKTVIYYLVIGFGVSGASYLAGELISQLMKKIESSDSTPSNGSWASY